MNTLSRYQGSLLGLAVGDALGTTLEFKSPGAFLPIEDMVGGGPFGLEPGQWTDDTSMALCLAESLIECGGFDAKDQMERYVRWWREGYLSSTDRCFDIGNTVKAALARFEQAGEPFSGSTDSQSAGNGSIMRLAPVPLFFAGDPERAIRMAGESSKTTHGAPEAVDACRYMAGLIVGALQGRPKDELLSSHFCPVSDLWERVPLVEKIVLIAAGSFKEKEPPQIRGTGYVVDSLAAALWAFHRSEDFQSGALLAVNLGDDADTTGAVYGQLVGAYYGVDDIPISWRGKITRKAFIEELSEGLLQHAGQKPMAKDQAPALPFARSYWVEPGRLLAGYYPGAPEKQDAERKLGALLDAGIRCVVNLIEEEEQNWNKQPFQLYSGLLSKLAAERNIDVTFARIPIRDQDVTSEETMKAILDVIDRALGDNRPVYVHCWGGRGRTGTVVGCYLVRHGIALGQKALERIADLRLNEPTADHDSPENDSQRSMVINWREGR